MDNVTSTTTGAPPAENEGSPDYFADYTTYETYRTSVKIFKVVPPILIALGTFGNVLSVYILTRRSIRSSTTSVYLIVLAFSDLIVLYTGLLRQWLLFTFDVDIRDIGVASCKIHLFLVYFSLDFSAWIIMAVTLERVVCTWFPYKVKQTCTKPMARCLLAVVGVFLFVFNAHIMFGYGHPDNTATKYKCQPVSHLYHYFFENTWAWLDLCTFCLVPFTFILLGNSLILYKVISSQNKAIQRVAPASQSGRRRRKMASSMTPVLVTVNVVFLVSTSPVSVYNTGYHDWAINADEETYAKLELWWAIVNMLMYTNNSLNFVLYVLSGSRFRHEFMRLIKVTFGSTVEPTMYNFDLTAGPPMMINRNTRVFRLTVNPAPENG